jgi:hypothetical protein
MPRADEDADATVANLAALRTLRRSADIMIQSDPNDILRTFSIATDEVRIALNVGASVQRGEARTAAKVSNVEGGEVGVYATFSNRLKYGKRAKARWDASGKSLDDRLQELASFITRKRAAD